MTPPDVDKRSFPLAREKNTERAEARRRTREQTRAEFLAAQQEADDELDDEVGGAPAAPEEPRRSMFRMPNIREDIAALPSIFRSRKSLWLPFLVALIGFGLVLVIPALQPELQSLAATYLQFFFLPPALFTFFIAGFFAPRAPYLVGAVVGLFWAALWAVLVLGFGLAYTYDLGLVVVPTEVRAEATLQYVVTGLLYGTLAAALASWYRDFLRGMQERGRARRAVKEVDERAKRREERQEARRLAKQRPSQ